jgi:hypothetical protein
MKMMLNMKKMDKWIRTLSEVEGLENEVGQAFYFSPLI